jgi:hypothetical protein
MANTFKNSITSLVGTTGVNVYQAPSATSTTVIGVSVANVNTQNISVSVNGYSFKSDDFDREYDIPVIRIGDVGDTIDFEDCIKVKSKFLEEKKENKQKNIRDELLIVFVFLKGDRKSVV